jgi:hypothetical protein
MLQDTHITQETSYAPLDASIDKWNTERTHIRRLRIYRVITKEMTEIKHVLLSHGVA